MGKMQCLNYSPHCTVRNACLRIAAKKNVASGRGHQPTHILFSDVKSRCDSYKTNFAKPHLSLMYTSSID